MKHKNVKVEAPPLRSPTWKTPVVSLTWTSTNTHSTSVCCHSSGRKTARLMEKEKKCCVEQLWSVTLVEVRPTEHFSPECKLIPKEGSTLVLMEAKWKTRWFGGYGGLTRKDVSPLWDVKREDLKDLGMRGNVRKRQRVCVCRLMWEGEMQGG